jgi:hydroxymethylpyrimidine/phosphomethylpyrimidine kinase
MIKKDSTVPVALTIAGSDSSGGAGLQVDLRTFNALGVYGYSAVTGVTAQNSRAIKAVVPLTPAIVAAQIEMVAAEQMPLAVKTGALFNAGIVRVVAARIKSLGLSAPVVDPVMVASSGRLLLEREGEKALRDRLIPISALVTPNIPEAERLAGMTIDSVEAMGEAARVIYQMGAGAVLIKGGHPFNGHPPRRVTRSTRSGEVIDLLYDGRAFMKIVSSRRPKVDLHGGGCVLSAAIAARLAKGDALPDATKRARRIIDRVLDDRIRLGSGCDVMSVVAPGRWRKT